VTRLFIWKKGRVKTKNSAGTFASGIPRIIVLFVSGISSGQPFNVVESITVYEHTLSHAVAYSYLKLISPLGDSQDEE
jgi:hypothetical protein